MIDILQLNSMSPLKEWRLKINEIISTYTTNYIPINHAHANDIYGSGSKDFFGHLKLSDEISLDADESSGIAATPKAVNAVRNMITSSVQLDVYNNGDIIANNFVGYLNGIAKTATNADVANIALNDVNGNDITTTYAKVSTVENLFSNGILSGTLKKEGVALKYCDILDANLSNASFLYQNSYMGYLPAINLQTEDGRVGIGTFENKLTITYFQTTNETNVPNSSLVLSATGFGINGNTVITGNIKASNGIFTNGITVSGDTTATVSNINTALKLGSTLVVNGTTTLTSAVLAKDNLTVSKNITCNGEITANVVRNAIWNDYAEFFEKGEETEVGDIIALDETCDEEKYVKASRENSFVVGVHSDTYGHIVGGVESLDESNKFFIPVGMVGRVKTKIVGSVKKGDKIVLSDIPGVGRKFNPELDNIFDVIGGVVETNLSEEIKLVNMKLK